MKKLKRNVEDSTRDRLSELPDSFLKIILGLLPMRDVVRTTILSRRWKNLWTTVPCLNFVMREMTADSVQKFVNRALTCWRGAKIVKFKVDFSSDVMKSLVSDIDLLVKFARKHEVEALCVKLMGSDGAYCVPQLLFSSCPSLKELALRGCSLCIPENVQWCNLRSLSIDGYRLVQHVIDKVLSGSPLLEVLSLRFMESGEDLSIQSSSLKELFLEKFAYFDDGESLSYMDRGYAYDEPWMDTELSIWTPNLEMLQLSGIPYCKCSLMNVSSLTNATLGFGYDDWFPGGTDVHEETLKQILPTIQHVENVTLSECCMEVLGAMGNKYMHSTLPHVKFLKLNGLLSEGEKIAGLLKIFPQLKMLVIENGSCMYDYGESLEFEKNLPKSFLLQLRTVEVTWCWDEDDDEIFQFLKFLLKHASKLEKMVFQLKGCKYLFWGSQELLRMPRSSPTVDFIFRHH